MPVVRLMLVVSLVLVTMPLLLFAQCLGPRSLMLLLVVLVLMPLLLPSAQCIGPRNLMLLLVVLVLVCCGQHRIRLVLQSPSHLPSPPLPGVCGCGQHRIRLVLQSP
jgi:hypothetical protein